MYGNHMMIDLVDADVDDDHQEDNFVNGGGGSDGGDYKALGSGATSTNSSSISKGSFSGENLSDASRNLFGTDDEFEDDDSEDSDDDDLALCRKGTDVDVSLTTVTRISSQCRPNHIR